MHSVWRGVGGGGGGGGEEYKKLGIIKFNQDFIRTGLLSGVNKHPDPAFRPQALNPAHLSPPPALLKSEGVGGGGKGRRAG